MPAPATVAILGGTFDPVHLAHLQLARGALRALDAGRLLWIPTGRPRYREPAVAPAADRVAMLKLAIAGEPRFAVDERELAPEASGYTVDTVEGLRRELPEARLALVMGADQYDRRASWHRWEDLARQCRIAVAARPGERDPEGATPVPMAPSPVSSSEIRARLGRGEDVSALLPPPVLEYIRARGLYR